MSFPERTVILSPEAQDDLKSILRPHLFPGCRVRLIERYIAYYRILDGSVEIVRILHERNDPARHLKA